MIKKGLAFIIGMIGIPITGALMWCIDVELSKSIILSLTTIVTGYIALQVTDCYIKSAYYIKGKDEEDNR